MKKDLRDYLNEIKSEKKRDDCFSLVKIMEEESGYKASLHGKIVGFGVHKYDHDGRTGEAVITGFLPRTQDFSLYIMPGFAEFTKELGDLGKHKTAKVCLYIRKLADIDEKVLRKIIKKSVGIIQKTCECRNA